MYKAEVCIIFKLFVFITSVTSYLNRRLFHCQRVIIFVVVAQMMAVRGELSGY